jgi:hypothetical protein
VLDFGAQIGSYGFWAPGHSSHALASRHAGRAVNTNQKVTRINCWLALNMSNPIF